MFFATLVSFHCFPAFNHQTSSFFTCSSSSSLLSLSLLMIPNTALIDCSSEINLSRVTVDIEEAGPPVSAMTRSFGEVFKLDCSIHVYVMYVLYTGVFNVHHVYMRVNNRLPCQHDDTLWTLVCWLTLHYTYKFHPRNNFLLFSFLYKYAFTIIIISLKCCCALCIVHAQKVCVFVCVDDEYDKSTMCV